MTYEKFNYNPLTVSKHDPNRMTQLRNLLLQYETLVASGKDDVRHKIYNEFLQHLWLQDAQEPNAQKKIL